MKQQGLLQTIGKTPLIGLEKMLSDKGPRLLAKLENRNPGGSIKDRAACYMIERAEERRDLDPSKTIIEATSGNMGIGLALVGTCKGYRVKIVMSEGMSGERRKTMEALGADLVLTDGLSGTEGAIRKTWEIIGENPKAYWFADQFNKMDNVDAHYHGIADEILSIGVMIDVLIAGVGTGGTIMGLARRFKEESPDTQIVGVLPEKGYMIQGLQNPSEDFSGDIFEGSLIDRFIVVSHDEAFESTRRVAAAEGLFVGMSSGAALRAASLLARTMTQGTVLAILPDGGERYLSTALYA